MKTHASEGAEGKSWKMVNLTTVTTLLSCNTSDFCLGTVLRADFLAIICTHTQVSVSLHKV